MKYIQKR